MALSIVALCVFLFGAYAYGSVVILTIRHHSSAPSPTSTQFFWEVTLGWRHGDAAFGFGFPLNALRQPGMAMYLVCTVWFILHSIIEFRYLMGEARENDLIDLAALELAFAFPGLILHTVLRETDAGDKQPAFAVPGWRIALAGLYATGLAMAIYFPLAIFQVIPAPQDLGPHIGISIGALFTVLSILCLTLMATRRRPSPTPDQLRLRKAMMTLFVIMMVTFAALTFLHEQKLLMQTLSVLTRATPLVFLLVSVYFENRTEFYDLVIKRGIIMLLSLVAVAATFAISLGWLGQMPGGMARPWLFAVVLLPVVMLLPWLHDRVGRILDRLWFGREFTPVEAIKHVLGGMQSATDEASLIAASQDTLSEMFRRPITIVMDDQPLPPDTAVDVALSGASTPIRLATTGSVGRPLLSEDLALLRSLGGVFAFMLENVRLQRKRQEQDQVAQELRLQTSRSELKALRAQINPHFLFNALNAIASLIHTDPARADAAVEQLAEVFRYTLRRSEQEWAPLDQELAFARAYLDVEQARFGRRLDFSIDAAPEVARAQVPSMLLQTLVENAVKHGISRVRTPGRIEVTASQQAGELTLEVRDTGPGIETFRRPSPSGESFGLRSVRDRLEGHFGTQASLDLFRDNEQTIARIRMPLIRELSGVAGGAR